MTDPNEPAPAVRRALNAERDASLNDGLARAADAHLLAALAARLLSEQNCEYLELLTPRLLARLVLVNGEVAVLDEDGGVMRGASPVAVVTDLKKAFPRAFKP